MKCPHCDVHVDEHETSRCLDAWVAETVMGWKSKRIHGADGVTRKYWMFGDSDDIASEMYLFKPSTSIADAWKVADKYGAFVLHKRDWGDDYWIDLYITEGQHGWADSVEASSAPLAICRAAIKANHNAR